MTATESMIQPDARPHPTSTATTTHDRRKVILVDTNDRPIGSMPKLGAHGAPGFLHRAFSVFVFDTAGRVLLQRRAATKYHFAGGWANTCCSHPEPGQTTIDAAVLRLEHEMGLTDIHLVDVGTFTYSALDPDSGLIEHELDHVLVGTTANQPVPNPDECDDHRWITRADLLRLLDDRPNSVTPWLRPAFELTTATTRPST